MVSERRNESDWRSLLGEIDWTRVRDRFGLSVRELQVVRHTLEGNSVGEVAKHLNLAVGTVKTYTGRIHAKLGVKNQCQLSLAVVNAALRTERNAADSGSRRQGPITKRGA